MDWIALLAATASIISVLYNYFKLREDRAKVRADAAKVAAEAARIHTEAEAFAKKADLDRWLSLANELQEDNERLRNRLREFEEKSEERENELAALRVGVLILVDQLEQLGVKPRWTPDRVSVAITT